MATMSQPESLHVDPRMKVQHIIRCDLYMDKDLNLANTRRCGLQSGFKHLYEEYFKLAAVSTSADIVNNAVDG
ncbi:hypothetical protein TURU_055962 [Turdus rufiventris]|nr:hypothetical protein TURU_055962 [Turdus rufiventris]